MILTKIAYFFAFFFLPRQHSQILRVSRLPNCQRPRPGRNPERLAAGQGAMPSRDGTAPHPEEGKIDAPRTPTRRGIEPLRVGDLDSGRS